MVNRYMDEFQQTEGTPGGTKYIIKEVASNPKNNPGLDYRKLIVMVGAALLAAIAYDSVTGEIKEDE